MKLTAEQTKLIAHYNEDQKKAFGALTDAEKTTKLTALAMISKPTDAGVKLAEANVDTEESYPIISPADLAPSTKIVARLLGTKSMFSTNKKENWDDDMVQGRQVWFNHHYVFENLETGVKFGVFKSPTLNRVLSKVRTAEAFRVHRGDVPEGIINPIVELNYVGLVIGKDKLKAEYDLEIQGGDKAHVFLTKIQEGVSFDPYESGIVNYINNPLPNFGGEAKLVGISARERDLARLQGTTAEGGTRLVEGGSTQQLSAPQM